MSQIADETATYLVALPPTSTPLSAYVVVSRIAQTPLAGGYVSTQNLTIAMTKAHKPTAGRQDNEQVVPCGSV